MTKISSPITNSMMDQHNRRKPFLVKPQLPRRTDPVIQKLHPIQSPLRLRNSLKTESFAPDDTPSSLNTRNNSTYFSFNVSIEPAQTTMVHNNDQNNDEDDFRENLIHEHIPDVLNSFLSDDDHYHHVQHHYYSDDDDGTAILTNNTTPSYYYDHPDSPVTVASSSSAEEVPYFVDPIFLLST